MQNKPTKEEIARALIEKRRKLPKGEKLPFAERNIINVYLSQKGIQEKKDAVAKKKEKLIPIELRKKGF